MSKKGVIVSLLVFASLAGCNQQAEYVDVYSVQVQTFLDRAALLNRVEAEAAKQGFSESPTPIGQSGYGVTLFKNGEDVIFQFSGTEGVSCYRLAVFAKDAIIAKEVSGTSREMIEGIAANLGDELRYSGNGPCPIITHNNAAQGDAAKPRAWP